MVSTVLLTTAWLAARPVASQDELIRGQALFQEHCASCHGPNGDGGRGPSLAVPKLRHSANDDELVRNIQYGISGTVMPESNLQEDDVKIIAGWVRKLGELPPKATPGNAERGARLYEQRDCARCHALRGFGGAIGPDLTDIGARRGSAHLRTSLTDPGADVPKSVYPGITLPENFLFVTAETRGRRIEGVRVNEDAFSIQIRDLAGDLHSLLKSEINALQKDWGKSPMPSYRALADEELDDLVAFLARQRGEP
jgi:cytochrome c oxidase cbb3-type subunit III